MKEDTTKTYQVSLEDYYCHYRVIHVIMLIQHTNNDSYFNRSLHKVFSYLHNNVILSHDVIILGRTIKNTVMPLLNFYLDNEVFVRDFT